MDWRKKTLKFGEAEYEYSGNCLECEKRLFVCTSHPIRNDEKLEGRITTFYADGTILCKECASDRL